MRPSTSVAPICCSGWEGMRRRWTLTGAASSSPPTRFSAPSSNDGSRSSDRALDKRLDRLLPVVVTVNAAIGAARERRQQMKYMVSLITDEARGGQMTPQEMEQMGG